MHLLFAQLKVFRWTFQIMIRLFELFVEMSSVGIACRNDFAVVLNNIIRCENMEN